LAEDIFAKNRADYEFSRGKVSESKKKRNILTEESAVAPNMLRHDACSIVDIASELQNTVYDPNIRDYYKTGSSSLRDYIHRLYLPWNQVLGIDREAMEVKLKALLDRAKQQGDIESMGWCRLPLPQNLLYWERELGETGLMFEKSMAHVGSKQQDEVCEENMESSRDTGMLKE